MADDPVSDAMNDVTLARRDLEVLLDNWDALGEGSKKAIVEGAVSSMEDADRVVGECLRELSFYDVLHRDFEEINHD